MSEFERHIIELESILKKLKLKENQAEYEFPGLDALFSLKMYHQDMLSLHKMVIEKIHDLTKLVEYEEVKESWIKNEIVDYRNKDFWRRQVDIMLNEKKHPLKSTDIINNSQINPAEKRQCMSILSNVLSELCEKGMIKKFKIDGEKGFYYALPNMILKKAD